PDDSGFELGRLHRTAARRLAAAGAARDAERAAADARIAFAGVGAAPWVRAVGTPVPEDGARAAAPARLGELSAEERAVAELVVRGLHNKEIAATLYLSVRTVELRLTRIYRKVGARSRAHLVAIMS
ncbi:helix-turn-helix transcriptional regulator, partial [Schumannella luteola]